MKDINASLLLIWKRKKSRKEKNHFLLLLPIDNILRYFLSLMFLHSFLYCIYTLYSAFSLTMTVTGLLHDYYAAGFKLGILDISLVYLLHPYKAV